MCLAVLSIKVVYVCVFFSKLPTYTIYQRLVLNYVVVACKNKVKRIWPWPLLADPEGWI